MTTDKFRNKNIYYTAGTSVINRILSVIVPLLVVKISIDQIGLGSYGVWMAILSFFTLFNFADFGLGSGLQTKLSKYQDKKEKEKIKEIISSVLILLVIISIVLTILFILINNIIDWEHVLNIQGQSVTISTAKIVLIVLISKIVSIPISIIQRVQFSFQEGFFSNLWSIISSLFTIICLFLVRFYDLNPLFIIVVVTYMPIIFLLMNFLHFFYIKNRSIKPNIKLINLKESLSQLKIGSQFLMLSILTTLGLTIDNFIVIRTSSLEDVSIFSIAFRVSSMIGIIITVLSYPLWSANSEAILKKDYKWVEKTTKKISIVSFSIAILISVFIIIFNKQIFTIWLGNTISIPSLLLSGLLIIQVAQAFISPYFMYLNSISNVRFQIIVFLIFTPFSIVVKFFISKYLEYILIPWIGSILYISVIVLPVYFKVKKDFKKNRKEERKVS